MRLPDTILLQEADGIYFVHYTLREAIDWGHVLDQWLGQRHSSMEELGALIQELVEKHNPANSSVPVALASIGPRRRR